MLQRLKFPTLRDVSPLFVQVKWLVLRESYFVSVEYEEMGEGWHFSTGGWGTDGLFPVPDCLDSCGQRVLIE